MCGTIQRNVTEDDPEYDSRFLTNHIVANESETVVAPTSSFGKDEVCVYVITKNQTYKHLTLSLENLVNTKVYLH